MATDPGRVVPFELGPYQGLCFDIKSLRLASRAFIGHKLMTIAQHLEFDTLYQMAAFGFMHEGKPVSDSVIERLIEAEPKKYFPLAAATKMALVLAHAKYMPGDTPGEMLAAAEDALRKIHVAAKEAAGPTSTASSASPADSGSTPPSSGG
jgi:hypothetical protein